MLELMFEMMLKSLLMSRFELQFLLESLKVTKSWCGLVCEKEYYSLKEYWWEFQLQMECLKELL